MQVNSNIELNKEDQTMAHHNTVLSELVKLIPRHEFQSLANAHHSGRSFRKASRWSQCVTMVMAQLSGRTSLRDITENLSAQSHRLYHLGVVKLSRSNLSRMNNDKPYQLYQALFEKLLSRCQSVAPGHSFGFKSPLYSLDATTIDLCLEMFPWAKFRTTKGAIKVHVGLNHAGYLPEFVRVSEGKTHDVNVGRTTQFPKGSLVAIDKAYNDYAWYKELTDKGISFVTRLKSNAKYRIMERRKTLKHKGITSDQVIKFTGLLTAKKCPIRLRRVGYRDPETGKRYVYLTNNFQLAAKTIAEIYKSRWQVELFFKWIKQNLKIKSFVGTSKNAVLTQIWIAMCCYLLTSFLKFRHGLGKTMQQILRILQLNLFEKRDLIALLRGDPAKDEPVLPPQLQLI